MTNYKRPDWLLCCKYEYNSLPKLQKVHMSLCLFCKKWFNMKNEDTNYLHIIGWCTKINSDNWD